MLFAVLAQRGDVRDDLLHHRTVIAPKADKIILHVVDQQRGAFRVKCPVDFVHRNIKRRW